MLDRKYLGMMEEGKEERVREVWGPQCLDRGIKHTSRALGAKRLMLSSTLSRHLPQLLGIKYLQVTWAYSTS